MKTFIMPGHRVPTDGSFRLDDLAGSAGRLDVICRAINSAFCLSHGIRQDVTLYLVFPSGPDGPKTIKMVSNELKYLNPDERSTGALIRNALIAMALAATIILGSWWIKKRLTGADGRDG